MSDYQFYDDMGDMFVHSSVLKKMRVKRRREKYEEYLQSDAWQEKRSAKLEEAGWKCQRCFGILDDDDILDVHHKTYERFGNERLDDLEVLCRECHRRHHGRVF